MYLLPKSWCTNEVPVRSTGHRLVVYKSRYTARRYCTFSYTYNLVFWIPRSFPSDIRTLLRFFWVRRRDGILLALMHKVQINCTLRRGILQRMIPSFPAHKCRSRRRSLAPTPALATCPNYETQDKGPGNASDNRRIVFHMSTKIRLCGQSGGRASAWRGWQQSPACTVLSVHSDVNEIHVGRRSVRCGKELDERISLARPVVEIDELRVYI
jgi:hypothetical protein